MTNHEITSDIPDMVESFDTEAIIDIMDMICMDEIDALGTNLPGIWQPLE